MGLFTNDSIAFTRRDVRNFWVFNGWLIATMVAYATAIILLRVGVIGRGPVAWTLAAIMTILALLTIRAFMAFLRQADELLRRIQLEALALGFGAGWMFMLCYRVFERLGAPQLDIAHPILIMAFTFAFGQYLGVRRYSKGVTS